MYNLFVELCIFNRNIIHKTETVIPIKSGYEKLLNQQKELNIQYPTSIERKYNLQERLIDYAV